MEQADITPVGDILAPTSRLFQSVFRLKIPPAPLSCCYKQLPAQHVDRGALHANVTFHQTSSTITSLFSLLTPDSLYFAFFFICTCQICYERKKESGAPLLLLQMKCRLKRPCRVFDEFIKANISIFCIILNNTAFNKLFLYLTSDCCDPV